MADSDPGMEIVTIFESSDPVAFQLAKAVLDEAGVEYIVHEDAMPGYGFSPMLSAMRRILIPASRKDWAMELIAGAEEPAERGEDDDPEAAE